MAENSKIEWTDHTFNPWVGCTKVSPACDHCYAEAWAKRTGHPELWGDAPRRRTSASNWQKPVLWNKRAAALGVRYRVFCASLADVFDNEADPQWRSDLFTLIEATPHLDWLLLTKRIGNVNKFCGGVSSWPNVWLGATVVTQEEVDRDVPKLLATPARIRFLSIEPMLEPITFEGRWVEHQCAAIHENWLEALNWIIVGGESGSGARPMEECWASDLQAQCEAVGTAFFFKQGSAANWPTFKDFESFPQALRLRQFPH